MTHVSAKEIDEMNQEQREATLVELRDEMLQLRSQQALGLSLIHISEPTRPY